ncbi:MAG: sulfatase-like hydrolase/transferase [Chloroflexi bacterium]|nr:sulfatase-like hydrolase/transferase [Chloroflexota bacterium]
MKPFFKIYTKKSRYSPLSLMVVTVLISFLYVFMEWVFIITKPSFINTSQFFEKGMIFLNSASLLAIVSCLGLLPFFLSFLVFRSKTVRSILGIVFSILPTFILSATILLLVDNFTYTVFKFGIVSTKGILRVLYACAFLLGMIWVNRRVLNLTYAIDKGTKKDPSRHQKRSLPLLLILLFTLAGIPAITALNPDRFKTQPSASSSLKRMPDILLITGDGINAAKLSVYGFEKDTTPFLKEFAKTSLVAQNAFSNAQGTIGSTTSLLTGKYPEDTRVLAASDILQGDDAFQHLPAILKENGYQTVQLSYSYYADAFHVNIQGGFDEANGQSPVESRFYTLIGSVLPTNYYYFIHELITRVTDRLGHLFFLKDMSNPYLQVTEAPEKFNDQQKLEYALTLIEKSDRPLFIHLHWMGTHGPRYYPIEQRFSKGEDIEAQGKFDEALYLDSILEFDQAVSKIYDALSDQGTKDNAILIVASDHTQRWTIARIPLIIHFPDSKHAGEIPFNVQNLDIAPTLLDYLEINPPDWMEGRSILSASDPSRPIFLAAIGSSTKDAVTDEVFYPDPVAPFFQFGKMAVILCNRWYQLDLSTLRMSNGQVTPYQGDCPNEPIDRTNALSLLIEHLKTYGFDTATLQDLEMEP